MGRKPVISAVMLFGVVLANPNQFEATTPGGETRCVHGTEWAFMHRRGTVDKIVFELGGGGACWSSATCSSGVCVESVNVGHELQYLNGPNSGMHDRNNEANPFREWYYVFIPYCTCDIHTGTKDIVYEGGNNTFYHRGHINMMAALNWTLANFPATPDAVTVSGCSAGSMGAQWNWPFFADAYPEAKVYMWGNGGVGIVSQSHYSTAYENWGLSLHKSVAPEIATEWRPDMVCHLNKMMLAAHPEAKMGLYTSTEDAVQTYFYRMGGGLGNWSEEMRSTLECIQENTTQIHTFIAEGTGHCVSQSGVFYTAESQNVSLVDWLANLTTDQSVERAVDCCFECIVSGDVLPLCPASTCGAVKAVAAALGGSGAAQSAPEEALTLMCSERVVCAEPLAKQVGTTVAVLCGPTGCAEPPVGTGSAGGFCAPVQQITGKQCCDDALGELAEVGATCEGLVRDLVKDCEAEVNSLLRGKGLCSVDKKGGGQGRRAKELCPVLCQNLQVEGCECPKAYDSGCPEHLCMVPDDVLYEWASCADCEVHGAVLKCSRSDAVKGALVVVLVIVVVLAVAGAGVVMLRAGGDGLRRSSSAGLRMAERIGARHTAAQSAIVRGLEAYRAGFEGVCYKFGWLLATHRKVVMVAVLTVMVAFAVCGLPQAEVDKSPTSEEWVPQGSLIASQLEFYNKWTPPSGRYPHFVLMVGPEAEGETALTRKYTEAFHRVTEGMREVGVEVKRADGSGTEVLAYEDYCLRTSRNPVFDQLYPGDKPCVQPTVLDCFFEGSWQLQNVSAGRWPEKDTPEIQGLERAVMILNMIFGTGGAIMDNYRDRPSYKNLTDAEIGAIYKAWVVEHGGCQNWAKAVGLVQVSALGGLQSSEELRCPRDPEQKVDVVGASTLNGVFSMNSADRLSLGRARLSQYLVEDLRSGYDELKEKLLEYFEEADNDETAYPGTKIVVIPSDFYETVVKQLSSAQFGFILTGYALMFTVIFWEIDLQSPMNNLAPVAAVYFLFIVALSTLAAYGFVAVMGFKYSHLMLQVLPYLSIGLGVDDMFLFLHYFREVRDKERHSSAEVVADLVHSAGRSVSLTSLTNLFTFFGGTVVTIPALRNYLVLAGLLVLFNYVSSVMCLPIMLSWWVDKHRAAALAEKEEEEKEEEEQEEQGDKKKNKDKKNKDKKDKKKKDDKKGKGGKKQK
eukprot:Hpha_TRINITY_DN16820_c6_g4::TRINITY_DN16820_c6_g4_i4::g.151504::m.151504/K06225/PTCH1; patched 1